MREILFRGKAKANDCCKGGYWVYGDLAHIGDMVCISVGKGRDNVEVIPETVGQYTGLIDKNGTQIFEGDIIQYQPEYEIYPLRSFVVYAVHRFNYPAFDLDKYDFEANGLQCAHEECGCEVVGNIHDSPKFLEGEYPNE